VHYWTRVVYQTGRAGNPASASNQCIVAFLARAGLNPHSPTGVAAWLALSAVVVILASRGMRYALGASEDCLAVVLNAFAALLISPVSWSHHWVWCVPALLTLATLGSRHRSRLALVAATTGLVVFATAPQFWFLHGPQRGIGWDAWHQATGSAYVLFAALILLAFSSLTRRGRSSNGQKPVAAASSAGPGGIRSIGGIS
jgi:alpha-1,2-mannosyltransferase